LLLPVRFVRSDLFAVEYLAKITPTLVSWFGAKTIEEWPDFDPKRLYPRADAAHLSILRN